MRKTIIMAMAAAMLALPMSAQKKAAPKRIATAAKEQKGLGLPLVSAKGAFDADALQTSRQKQAMKKADAADVIYSQDFNNQLAGLNNMTVIDANADGSTWDWYGNRARCAYHRTNKMDDWLITPPLRLEAGKLYRFSIKGQAYSDRYPERLEVKLGNAATAEAMTQQIIEPQDIKTDTKQTYTNDHIMVETTGDYYFGVHGISDADCMYLYVDDILVTGGAEASMPGKVTDLQIVPDASGARKAVISFNAPTLQINGTPQTEAMDITISRNGTAVKTFTAVAPGTALSYTDMVDYAGAWEYVIVASVGGNAGDEYRQTVFVGLDAPSALQNVTIADYSSLVRFNYDPISTKGKNGGVVVPEDVTVDLFSVVSNDVTGGIALDELLDSSQSGYVDMDVDTNVGPQTLNYFALIPWNDAGDGPTEWAPVYVGAPTKTPYFENFKGHKFNNFWSYDISSASVGLYYSGKSSDDDGTSINFNSVAGDEYGFIESGKINIKGQEKATISLDACGEAGNSVSVSVVGTDGVFKNMGSFPLTSDYNTINIDIAEFNTNDFVRVRIQADFAVAGNTFIDNICVLNQLDKNLALTDIYVEKKPAIGTESEVLLTINNYGKQTISNYNIALYANGEKVADRDCTMDLEPMKNITEILAFVPSIFCTGELELKGVVTFDGDMYDEDNVAVMSVNINRSIEDQPEGFNAAISDGKAVLTWDAANDNPKLVTEDFEGYTPWIVEPNEPYSTTTLGPWTMVNNDNSYAGYLWQEASLPCEFESFAYVVTNLNGFFEEGYNDYPGHSGDQYLSAFYGFDVESLDPETYDMDYAEQNDWLISPELSGNEQTISFWYQAPGPLAEYFYIQTSTTDNKLESFTPLTDLEMVMTSEYDTDWKEYAVTLPAGTKYFAINRNDGADDGMWFMLDDISYERIKHLPTAYNVYVDHQLVATLPVNSVSYTYDDAQGNHEYSLTAVYANGNESEPVSITLDTDGIHLNAINADNTSIPTYNILGQRVNSVAKGIVIRQGKKQIVK